MKHIPIEHTPAHRLSKHVLAGLLATASICAHAAQPDITVMTQNQYLGADLTPIVSATSPEAYNLAVLDALYSIADNRFPERAAALAKTINDRAPHLVALQEVFSFECIESGTIPGACALFAPAMNDHLDFTMGELDALGADYYVAAEVHNLDLPGLPVFLNADAIPDVYIAALDRDVILARSDVATSVVPLPCARPSMDGCNFDVSATATTLAGPIEQKRGFIAVDAVVNGQDYRFVNTHLEIRYPAPDPNAPLIQAFQASQLIGTLSALPMPAGSKLLVAGDINSSPLDPVFVSPYGPAYPPYRQLAEGVSVLGQTISAPYTDTWALRPGNPPGYTCCETADLSNEASNHDERIDVIFSLPAPARIKANVLNNDPEDKTPSGLWPSDHASVVSRITY